MQEVGGSSPLTPTKQKRSALVVDLFCLARVSARPLPCQRRGMWFAFPPQSASSLLVSGKARNIDARRQNPPEKASTCSDEVFSTKSAFGGINPHSWMKSHVRGMKSASTAGWCFLDKTVNSNEIRIYTITQKHQKLPKTY